MMVTEQIDAVINEASSWIGTPYHHGACVKGSGVSCAWFIAEVFNRAIGTSLYVQEYHEQWFLNSNEELYLDGLKKQGFIQVKDQRRGNLVVSKTDKKLYCHGGIIVNWPSVIHTSGARGTQIVRSAYSSWFFGQDPDSLIFMIWKDWNVR